MQLKQSTSFSCFMSKMHIQHEKMTITNDLQAEIENTVGKMRPRDALAIKIAGHGGEGKSLPISKSALLAKASMHQGRTPRDALTVSTNERRQPSERPKRPKSRREQPPNGEKQRPNENDAWTWKSMLSPSIREGVAVSSAAKHRRRQAVFTQGSRILAIKYHG